MTLRFGYIYHKLFSWLVWIASETFLLPAVQRTSRCFLVSGWGQTPDSVKTTAGSLWRSRVTGGWDIMEMLVTGGAWIIFSVDLIEINNCDYLSELLLFLQQGNMTKKYSYQCTTNLSKIEVYILSLLLNIKTNIKSGKLPLIETNEINW